MSNAQMRAGRIAEWAEYRRKLRAILAHLAAGRTVLVVAGPHTSIYSGPERGVFVAMPSGLFVQRRDAWHGISPAAVRLL